MRPLQMIIVLCLSAVISAGCTSLKGADLAAPAKLRQIEPLPLETAEPDQREEPRQTGLVEVAPPEVQIALEQCRQWALANNLDLQVALLSPSIAAETVGEEEARFEAVLFSGLEHTKTDTPAATSLTATQEETTSADLGVRLPLQTGGTVQFDLASYRSENNNEFTTLNPSYEADASVSISQPLLRGGGVWVNTHAIRVAQYSQQRTEALTKLEVIWVLATVERVYWRFYEARRQLEVRRKEHALAEAQLAWARRRVDAGVSPEVEVVRAEAGVAARLEGVIRAEEVLRQQQRRLKRLLNQPGLGVETATTLVPQTDPAPRAYELDTQQLWQAALESRMELLEMELQIAEQASTIDFEKNRALPLLAVDYEYTVNGLGEDTSSAWDMVFDHDFADHRIGLQVEVPLGNKAAQHRLRRAILRKRQYLATRQQREALIREEVLYAADRLETGWQLVLASRQRTVLAAREMEAEERQFELGLRTSIDVLETQERFADAQTAEVQALAEYQIALVDLAQSTGTILGAARVRWQPQAERTGSNRQGRD